ncbi:MAG: hypothetical protein EP338_05735 [Bacteroidetes bacterium]|nr:MAG: hypothetical protein EP338_05735 [Bacteroidota bacterium]
MKKTLFLFSLLCFFFNVSLLGQNLVPNPSFEEYFECPALANACSIEICKDWVSFAISPDYMNDCDNVAGCSVPNNLSYQLAYEGSAYAAFFTYDDSFSDNNIREYLGVKLTQALEVGQTYKISMNVSLAYNSQADLGCGTNNLGILFTKSSFELSDRNALTKNFSHLLESNVILDTSDWVSLETVFVADSSYEYLAIGNFFEDSQTTTQKLSGMNQCRSYYYVDNVTVEKDSMNNISSEHNLPILNYWFTGNNLTVDCENCKNGPVKILVYDNLGRLLIEQNSLLNENPITVPDLFGNIFYIKIVFSDKISTKNLLKN